MQLSLLLFRDLNGVSSCNLNSQKDGEDKFFLQNNILLFVIKCTEFHKYVTTQMIACVLYIRNATENT